MRTRAPALSLLLALAGLVLAAATARADGPTGKGEHIEVELLSRTKTFAPGSTATVGLRFRMEPRWHVYWVNPGDSGTSPTVKWTLPKGFEAGPIRWPAPIRVRLPGPLEMYGYVGDVVLPVELRVPADATGEVELSAAIEWLVCDEECVPGDARLTLKVPVAPGTPEPEARVASLFAAADALQPEPWPGAGPRATSDGRSVALTLPEGGPWSDPTASLHVFPDEEGVFAHADDQPVRRDGGRAVVTVPIAREHRAPVARVRGLLDVAVGGRRRPLSFDVPVEGSAAPAIGPAVAPAAAPPATGPQGEVTSLGWALLLAFLGGVILNVMPCVLPVLSVKILGFVSQAGEDPKTTFRHGLVFGIGVLVSFLALAGLLLALRAGGELLGWGFQLQEPIVVGSLALLLLLLALNLFGVFEFGMGIASLAGGVVHRAHAHGYARSFADGAMATLIATPCTAPFMGGAVGYALTAPAAVSLLVFSMVGLGMAAPYVLLSANPSWLARVPRPGPWMITFKQLMAFPVLATVLYLCYVFGEETGTQGLTGWTGLLSASLVLSTAAWVFGRWSGPTHPPVVRRALGWGLSLALAVVAIGVMVDAARKVPEAPGKPPEGWIAFSPTVVDAERAKGRVVFLDFTAAWCATCKANEALILESDTVRAAVRRLGVVTVQADWTRKDADIAKALASFGRASVPLYVVYAPDAARPPEVLPTTITAGMVVDALERAAAGGSAKVPPAGRGAPGPTGESAR